MTARCHSASFAPLQLAPLFTRLELAASLSLKRRTFYTHFSFSHVSCEQISLVHSSTDMNSVESEESAGRLFSFRSCCQLWELTFSRRDFRA